MKNIKIMFQMPLFWFNWIHKLRSEYIWIQDLETKVKHKDLFQIKLKETNQIQLIYCLNKIKNVSLFRCK